MTPRVTSTLTNAAAKVGDFNGKTLSSVSSSVLLVDAVDIDGVAALRAWYDQGGGALKAQALSAAGRGGRADRRVTSKTIKDEVRLLCLTFWRERVTCLIAWPWTWPQEAIRVPTHDVAPAASSGCDIVRRVLCISVHVPPSFTGVSRQTPLRACSRMELTGCLNSG
jgi:hypothetical protein